MKINKEYDIFKLQLDIRGVNPLVYLFKLLLGIFFIIVSILWWCHMYFFLIQINIFINK